MTLQQDGVQCHILVKCIKPRGGEKMQPYTLRWLIMRKNYSPPVLNKLDIFCSFLKIKKIIKELAIDLSGINSLLTHAQIDTWK